MWFWNYKVSVGLLCFLFVEVGRCSIFFSLKRPEPCMELYCTDVPSYPEKAIIDAVNDNPYYKDMLSRNAEAAGALPIPVESVPKISGTFSRNPTMTGKGSTVQSASSGPEEFRQACDIQPVLTEYPKTARNIKNQTRYIVNAGPYRQPVSSERCSHEESPCSNIVKYLTPQLSTACRSQSVKLTLFVYDEMSNKVGVDDFSVPTACLCYFVVKP